MAINDNKSDAYKVVKTCNTLAKANIYVSLLNSNGIECFKSDTSFVNLFPSNPITGSNKIEIRVRPEDEEIALEILNAKFDTKDLEE